MVVFLFLVLVFSPLCRAADSAATDENNIAESLGRAADSLYLAPNDPSAGEALRSSIWESAHKIQNTQYKVKLSDKERLKATDLALEDIRGRKEYADRLLVEIEAVDKAVRENPGSLMNTLWDFGYLNDDERGSSGMDLEVIKIQKHSDNLRNTLKKRIQGGSIQNSKILHEVKGFLWFYEGELSGALNEWEQALQLDKSDEVLEKNIAKVRKRLEARTAREEVEHLIATGMDYYKNGQYNESRESFAKALELEPGNNDASLYHSLSGERLKQQNRETAVNVKLNRAYQYLSRGEVLAGVRFLVEVLEMDPGNKRALGHLAGVKKMLSLKTALMGASEEETKGKTKTAGVIADRKKSEEFYVIGMAHYFQNDLSKAAAMFERALESDLSFEEAAKALESAKKEMQK